jgi:dolichol-phosphate mannosyltransferase
VQSLRCFPERLRYFPGIVTDTGFRTQVIFADRNQRNQGTSRMGFKQLARFAMLAWFSYSTLPIHLITGLGMVISLISFLAGMVVIAVRIFTDYAIAGWSSLLAAQFFMSGLIILSLGVVGQYIGIIFSEVKRRPLYFIASVEENPSSKSQ